MNWKTIIQELQRIGLSQTEIARQTGIAQSVLSDILRGKQKSTSWESGQALIALAAKNGVLN